MTELPAAPVAAHRPSVWLVERATESAAPALAQGCGLELQSTGFPAIAAEGSHVAYMAYEAPHEGDHYLAQHVVLAASEPGAVTRRWALQDGFALGEPSCAEFRVDLRRRVRAVNRALMSQRWRRLDELPVSTKAAPPPLPPSAAAVQASVRAGWFVVQVPGVVILERQTRLEWTHRGETCEGEHQLQRVFGDRETGTGLLVLEGPCGASHEAIVHLGDRTFDEAERRAGFSTPPTA